jgi:cytochrome bd-type quinol oxidase subunit 2
MIGLSSLLAAAEKISPSEIGYENPIRDSNHSLDGILTLVYVWAGIFAVIVIIVAGYLFITARGDPAQIKRGKDAVRGAVIGLMVIILAFVITQFILGRF